MTLSISFDLSKEWFHGAVLAELAATFAVLGLCMQRRAHLHSAKPENPGRFQGVSAPGAALLFLSFVLASTARLWAPGITVEPVFVVALFLNAALSSSVLLETYRVSDLITTGMAGIFACLAVSAQTPTHRMPSPTDKLLWEESSPITSNWGFMIYVIFLISIVLSCLVVNSLVCSRECTRESGCFCRSLQRFTLPLLSGIFFAAVQNFLCVGLSILTSNGHLEIDAGLGLTWSTAAFDWNNKAAINATIIVLTVALISAAVAYCLFAVGTQAFECRYFTATSVGVAMATMSTADLLLARKWTQMTTVSIIFYGFANCMSIISVFLVSDTETAVTNSPSSDTEAASLANQGPADGIQVVTVSPGSQTGAITNTLWYQAWFFVGRCLPFLVVVQVPILYGIFFFMPAHSGHTWFVFTVLTIYSLWQSYQYGLHLVTFSIGGQRKIKTAIATDFRLKYEAEKARQPVSPGSNDLEWEDVFHVVVIANYKEHVHILREAIDSVAASPIAPGHITLVLAMEEREDGSHDKANSLLREYSGSFQHAFATFHPDGMPNEIKGKASNIHWAFARICDYIAEQPEVNEHQVLVTVGDADSEFHSQHFSALTEAFLNAGPGREENIWQPPMFHLKNYHTQPAPIRLGSLLTSQHELANLTDPYATALPYSTYTVPMRLLRAVGDFDPDWISEDWHIGLKCGLATMGRCRVRPLFLPVFNYAPEEDSYWKTIQARWQQAKRHALGFTEIAYIWGSLPLAIHTQPQHQCSGQAIGGAAFIFQAMLPLAMKVLSVHGVTSTLFLLAPLNSYMVFHFWSTGMAECIGSWIYVANFTASSLNGLVQVCALYSGVKLYEQSKPRILPPESGESFWFRNQLVHMLRLILEAPISSPLFFLVSGVCEWIASLKSIFSYKFTHDVAAKPPSSAETKYEPLMDESEVVLE